MVTSHKQLLHLCVGKETNGPKAQRGQLRSEVDQFFPRTRHRDRFTKKNSKRRKKTASSAPVQFRVISKILTIRSSSTSAIFGEYRVQAKSPHLKQIQLETNQTNLDVGC
jgi:hypothetical protein